MAYFRAAYTPRDFPSEAQWEARLMLERSRAVKCPTLAYQLVGTKKVQQVLAEPGQLERFLGDAPEAVARLRSCFAGLYSLDDASSEAIVAKALAHPHDYVLKPQREGGGNNLYEQDLHKALSTMKAEERAACACLVPPQPTGHSPLPGILMDRIVPPTFETVFLRDGQVICLRAVSELGIYSVFIGYKYVAVISHTPNAHYRRGDHVVLNEEAGHLLRSKNASQDDGGTSMRHTRWRQ